MGASLPSLRSLLALAIISYLVYSYVEKLLRRRKTPPGPRPLPILGNIRDLPAEGTPEFQHWLKHKDVYGPISSVTVMGTTMVIIHDKEAAHEILDRNSSKTSGRPTMVFANDLCGYGSFVLCQEYTRTFRHCRKLLHQELGTKASAAQFRDVQDIEIKRQLVRSLNEPEKWLDHFHTTASATILKMAYGYSVETHKMDPLVKLTDRMMNEFTLAAIPGAWAVDLIPALRHIPDNFPGAEFKKTANKWRKTVYAAGNLPYRFVRRQMARSMNRPSFVSKLVEKHQAEDGTVNLTSEDEHAITWTAATLYGAASDTTAITLTAFTLAMIMFPHVQPKAQEEIDRVIGTNRLPTFDDRDKLPYINAVVKETLRWWPIAPLSFPHKADEAFTHNGLYIPKGSYLLPAVWWFLHDPEVYAEPDTFDPERFLSPRNEPDPSTEAFGYGRRICAGQHFADSGLFLNIVNSLATFNLNKAVDAAGKEIDVDATPKPGVICYPNDFQFRATPRSPQHAQLIRQFELNNAWESSDAGLLENAPE